MVLIIPGLSESAFNRLLYILHTFILPAENNLPTSYADLLKLLKPDLCPVMDYHCCINDCVVYCDSGDHEYAGLSKCPECDEDRYETGTMIPRKRFKYMPLENRVRRMFANKITSQLLQIHSVIDANDGDIVISTSHQHGNPGTAQQEYFKEINVACILLYVGWIESI